MARNQQRRLGIPWLRIVGSCCALILAGCGDDEKTTPMSPTVQVSPGVLSYNPLSVDSIPDFFVGYSFQSIVDLEIVSLAAYDHDANGLAVAHRVGLWAADQTFLGSVTVTSADPLAGSFRYHALSSPIPLTAGRTYYIAGEVTQPDPYVYEADTIVLDARIANLQSYFRSTFRFGFPNMRAVGREYLSVNFAINPSGTSKLR